MSNKSICYAIILLVTSVITHSKWFDLSSVLNYSDWFFWPHQPLTELWYSWGTWINFYNFGSGNIQIFFLPFKLIWSILPISGLTYDIATKITFFFPIAIFGFLGPYFLFRKLAKDDYIAFVVALFYGSTTYFLVRQTGHLPIALIYSLLPILFLFYLEALEENALLHWLRFTLFFWLMSVYELRIVYILVYVLLLYFIFFHIAKLRKYLKNILISGVVFIFLSLFWILPVVLGGLTEDVASVANRGLFGSWLFSMKQAFTLFESSWTGSYPDMNFRSQPIPWYFLLIPFLIFLTFFARIVCGVDRKEKKIALFFAIISLIGIFLSKQSGQPFVMVYQWLYENYPGFNLFREASKFYILTSFGYAGLLGYGLLFLKDRWILNSGRRLFYMVCTLVIVLSLWNLKPLATGEIGTLFVSRQMPEDYSVFENYIIDDAKKTGFYRTFWSPTYSRWGIYDNQHPKISNIDVVQSNWSELYRVDKASIGEFTTKEQIIWILKQSFSEQLMNISSVRYVIVPLQDFANDDDFFKHYGNRSFFLKELDSVSYLHRINIGTKKLIAYENKNYRPHIYITQERETIYKNIAFEDVDFKFINPSEYVISLKNITNSVYVNFTENYNPKWRVCGGGFHWFDVITQKDNCFTDQNHFANNANLNSFLINPYEVCKKNEDDCKKNADGTYDIDLRLFFQPQAYFYLGLIFSCGIFIICISYFGFAWQVSRKRKMSRQLS